MGTLAGLTRRMGRRPKDSTSRSTASRAKSARRNRRPRARDDQEPFGPGNPAAPLRLYGLDYRMAALAHGEEGIRSTPKSGTGCTTVRPARNHALVHGARGSTILAGGTARRATRRVLARSDRPRQGGTASCRASTRRKHLNRVHVRSDDQRRLVVVRRAHHLQPRHRWRGLPRSPTATR